MPRRRNENDAIAAIATPPGRSAIGVVRVSGAGTAELLQALVGKTITPRRATLARFRDAAGGVIDQGVALFFPAPNSYTGEDVAELQGHGGPIVTQLVLRRCLELGARIAEPGEFTRRAFLNDKLDLTQAEGVADLIDAATVEAARCAARSLEGDFSRRVRLLGAALTDLRVHAEANIDFPEDEIDALGASEGLAHLDDVREQLAATIAASKQGKLLREGINVVIAGEPNVGKSSLLNQLAGDEVAIVTETPGTTRDAIRETINLSGVPFHVADTAGLRVPQDQIERIGIARALEHVQKADVVLWVSDATRPETGRVPAEIDAKVASDVATLVARNKIDITGDAPGRNATGEMNISAKTGAGLTQLKDALLQAAGWGGNSGAIFLARERHLTALNKARDALLRAREVAAQADLFAEELRIAQAALGEVLGLVTADDLLGEIFSRFCIGK